MGLFQFVIRLGPSMSTPAGGFHPPRATDRGLPNLESISGAKTGDVLCTGRDLQFAMSYVSPLFEASGGSEEMIYRCLQCGFRFSEAV